MELAEPLLVDALEADVEVGNSLRVLSLDVANVPVQVFVVDNQCVEIPVVVHL